MRIARIHVAPAATAMCLGLVGVGLAFVVGQTQVTADRVAVGAAANQSVTLPADRLGNKHADARPDGALEVIRSERLPMVGDVTAVAYTMAGLSCFGWADRGDLGTACDPGRPYDGKSVVLRGEETVDENGKLLMRLAWGWAPHGTATVILDNGSEVPVKLAASMLSERYASRSFFVGSYRVTGVHVVVSAYDASGDLLVTDTVG